MKNKDHLIDNKFVYDLELMFINIFGIITKIITVLFLIGFFQDKPIKFLEINFVIKILIAFFLIYRFNNYRTKEIEFTELDRKVSFSAGVYILIISFADILNGYVEKLRGIVTPYTLPFVKHIREKIDKMLNIK